MKKIAFIASSWLTYQHFFLQHALILSKRYDITFIFDHEIDGYEKFDNFSCRTIHVEIPRRTSIFKDFKSLIGLYRVMNKEDFSAVVTLSPKAGLLGMLAASFLDIRTRIHIFQGAVWASKKNIFKTILILFDYIIALLALKKLFVSNSLCELYRENGFYVTSDEVIGRGSICGVDLIRFKKDLNLRQNARLELGFRDTDVVCIYLGRVTTDKGIRELIEAFALANLINSNVKLLIVGPEEDDSFRLAINKHSQIKSSVKRVEYTKTPEKFLNASDIFIFPSYREGFGMAVIEASAVGLPIIASRIPGVVDAVVENVTGLLTDGSASSLANHITLLSNNEFLRKKIGHNGSLFVGQNYDSAAVVRLYCNFFENEFG